MFAQRASKITWWLADRANQARHSRSWLIWATAGERIVRVRNLKIRVHTLKHGCLLPSHGRKVRADGLSHQHGLSVRGSVALAGDGQQEYSRELKFHVSLATLGARIGEQSAA